MSYLKYPWIGFSGKAYCNPSTGDNNDLADIFDVDLLTFTPTMTPISSATVTDPENEQTFNYTGPLSAPECRTWLMGLLTAKPGNTIDGGQYGQQAHWNYYGDHATRIDNAVVNSVQYLSATAQPPGIAVPDPLMTATVQLIGTPSGQGLQLTDPVIVDNDPYALITSQVYSYGFTVTGKDATGNPVTLISANPSSRAFAYYINVQKNLDPCAKGFQGVSAVFICSVPKGPGLVINTSAGSEGCRQLADAVNSGAGLQMRYIFYNAVFQIEANDLYNQFKNVKDGNYPANPYIGYALGTIGALGNGEMLSAPPGRKLNVQVPFVITPPTNKCDEKQVRFFTPPMPVAGGDGDGDVDDPPPTLALGITQVEIDPVAEMAYVDCISTFPESNVQTNDKFDVGPMFLRLYPDGGFAPINLGQLPNDKDDYQVSAGMVALPLSNLPQLAQIKDSVASGTLAIYSGTQQKNVLTESAGLDFQTDDRAIYFDVQTLTDWSNPNEQPVPGTSQIVIQAFRRGAPIQQSANVLLEYWMCAKDFIDPSKPEVPVPSRYYTIAGAVEQSSSTYPNPLYNPDLPIGPDNEPNCSVITDQVTIPAGSNGTLTLNLSALRPGTSIIRFRDPAIPQVTPNFCWENTDYACIRILPFDDYRAVPDQTLNNWPYIYAEFFNYFALLYPIMSTVMPWGPNDAPSNPAFVAKFAQAIMTLTNPDMWDSTLYMPITRDLSAGKRALLWRWCNLQMR